MKLASGRVSWARHGLTSLLSRIGRLAWLVTIIALGVDSMGYSGAPAAVSGIGTIVTLLALIASYVVGLTGAVSPGELEIVGNELQISRHFQRRVPLDEITSAWVIEKRMPGTTRKDVVYSAVEIEIRGRDIVTAYARSRSEAAALVDALGFGRNGKRVRIGLAKDTRRLLHPILGFLSYILSMVIALVMVVPLTASTTRHDGISYFIIGPLSLLLYAGLKHLLRVPDVTVGNDGIEVHGLRRRFIPRSDLVSVSQNVAALPLLLHLRDGSMVPVTAMGTDLERRVAVGRLIEKRLFDTEAPEKTYVFERRDRSIKSWREELQQAMSGSDYRAIGTTPDDAEAVLKSPLTTPEQRIGAALALRVAGEVDRVRVAAEAAADPEVRVALEAVANDDDDGVEKALKRRAV